MHAMVGINTFPSRGGHWGLRYCGIGQFFMRYFGNFNLELRYCGILQACGTRFRGVLVDDSWYKKRILHIFRPFLAVSGRFGSNLKQPYFIAHFNEQFDCFIDQLKALLLFPRSHRSLLPLILPSRQRIRQLYRLTMKLRYFPDFVLRYCGICRFFFCGNAVFSNPQCPPPST